MDKGLLDIGLLLEPVDMEKYDHIRIRMKENWVVLMHPDALLAEKDAVTAEDLQNLPLILPRRMNVQSELASWFGDIYKRKGSMSSLPAIGARTAPLWLRMDWHIPLR